MINPTPPRGDRSGLGKRFFVIIGLIIVTAAVLFVKSQRQVSISSQVEHRKNSKESRVSAQTSFKKSDVSEQHQPEPLPRLIDLGADKCIPCKMMAPILEQLKEEYEGTFEIDFIDVWKKPEAGRPWRIRVIPTQIFLDGSGKELFRHEGFFSKEDILMKWEELGVDVER